MAQFRVYVSIKMVDLSIVLKVYHRLTLQQLRRGSPAPAAGGTHNSKIFPGEQPSEPWRMTRETEVRKFYYIRQEI